MAEFGTVDVGCTGSRKWIWNNFTILIFISLYRLVLDFILMNQLNLINIKNKNMKEHFSDSCSFLISDVIMTILLRHLLWLTIKLYPSKMDMFIWLPENPRIRTIGKNRRVSHIGKNDPPKIRKFGQAAKMEETLTEEFLG